MKNFVLKVLLYSAAIAGVVFLGIGYAHSQTDNTIYVRNFAGANVGAKVAAAQLTCGPNTTVPCILVIDPSLAAWPAGTIPTLCSHCYLWDFRSGPPTGGSSTWNSLTHGNQTGSGTSQLNTLPGSEELGVAPSVGDSSLLVPTTNWVNTEIAQGGAWPYTPQFAYMAYASSGTTLTDIGPHSYNGTFASSPNAPSFNPAGTGIFFQQNPNAEAIYIPYQALDGVQSLLLFYTPVYPATYVNDGQPRYLIADCAHNGISGWPSRFGMESIQSNNNVSGEGGNEATDRLIGNVAVGFTFPQTGNYTPIVYPWGHGATSYLVQNGVGPTFSCTSGNGAIGIDPEYVSNNYFGTTFMFYGAVGFSQVLTGQQMQQAINYGSALIQQHGGPNFVEPQIQGLNWYDGDSRTAFYGQYDLVGSRPWEISSLIQDNEQFYNLGIAGQQLSNINSNFATVTAPYFQRISSTQKAVFLDAITNDILAGTCTTASACYSEIQTYGSNVAAAAPGTVSVYATSLGRYQFNSTEETLREAVNADVISGALAGTFDFTGVDDIADDPIAATQVFPNSYSTTPPEFEMSSCTTSGGTATCSVTVPSYACYQGAEFTISGVVGGSNYNGTFGLTACTGSSISFIGGTSGSGSGGLATYLFNPAWWNDGIHENPALIAEMSTQEAASKLAAQGKMKSCFQIKKTIPWQVLAASQASTQALTQTIPLLQLFPGWQVCSIQANVSTAFSGSGISTLTMSIGDSNGSSTQYSSAVSIKSTGWAIAPTTSVSVPTTPNGMVQMNFTATGADVALVSAGQMTISIGVVQQ